MTETLNLSDLIAQAEAAGADFKAVRVPPMKYKVKVVRTNYKTSKGGNPGISLQTEILEGPEQGKKFWTNLYLNPVQKNGEPNNAGIAIFFRTLSVFGVSTEEFKAGLTVQQVVDSNRLIGAEAEAEVVDHTYQGETSSQAKSFKKLAQTQGFVPPAPVPQGPQGGTSGSGTPF